MRILTLDNVTYDLDHLPEEVDDMRFAILDNSNPADPDYHFIPLIFLESFNAPALVLRIGEHTIKMPMDWQILINVGGAAALSSLGWFARQIWDSVNQLKNDVKQIEIDLPTHYIKKDEIKERFDRIEVLLDKLYEKLEQKADK
jgi:hypothetical protein